MAEFQRETWLWDPMLQLTQISPYLRINSKSQFFTPGGSFLPGAARAAATAATEGPREAAIAAAGGVGETVVSP